jgi:plasminogen activator inhibitor 1 RNA-binding protein
MIRETVEAVNTEETAAVTEDEKKPEDAPQTEVETVKEGEKNEEEEKEAEEDKVYFWNLLLSGCFALCLGMYILYW